MEQSKTLEEIFRSNLMLQESFAEEIEFFKQKYEREGGEELQIAIEDRLGRIRRAYNQSTEAIAKQLGMGVAYSDSGHAMLTSRLDTRQLFSQSKK